MRDFWLSRLFFDLQAPAAAAEFRTDRAAVMKRYPLAQDVRRAILEDDVPFLAQCTNPYLLRYYFFATGMKDEEFIRRLRGG